MTTIFLKSGKIPHTETINSVQTSVSAIATEIR